MKKEIVNVLNRYFECRRGVSNSNYDENYSAQNALDAIAKAVGYDV